MNSKCISIINTPLKRCLYNQKKSILKKIACTLKKNFKAIHNFHWMSYNRAFNQNQRINTSFITLLPSLCNEKYNYPPDLLIIFA
jgi:hypothetical protein